MEPLFLKPVYKEILWGGQGLKRIFGRDLPYEKTAESWEICAHKNGTNAIENGEFCGKTLEELFLKKDIREMVFGTKCMHLEKFPVLNKFIDANDRLSLQVHPNDEYAIKNENDLGKTEMWYIVDAKENSKLIYGAKANMDKEEFKNSILNGNLEEKLNYVSVEKGDIIFIPAGTLHAIMEGLIIYEIQQNSDTTYRVFDWNRVDKDGNARQLHIDKALDVIDFNFKPEVVSSNNELGEHKLIWNEYFSTSKICIKDKLEDESDKSTFWGFTVMNGRGYLKTKGKEYKLIQGTTFIIPALLGKFEMVSDDMEIIKTFV